MLSEKNIGAGEKVLLGLFERILALVLSQNEKSS